MIHTVISADTSLYQHWQAQLLAHSVKRVGQVGRLTRLVATDNLLKIRPLVGIETFPTQTYSYHPVTRDYYPPYNKAASLREWAASTRDLGETILVIDPDCVFLKPILTEVESGKPIGERMFYMGCQVNPGKRIIRRFCRKNAQLCQPIGVPLSIRKCDLRVLCPRWIELIAYMREDKKTRADCPWIIEMWGYVVAAAEAGLTHILDNRQQFNTDNHIHKPIIHYGYRVDNTAKTWSWDKRTYKPFMKILDPPEDTPLAQRILHVLLDEVARAHSYDKIG